MFCSIRFLCFQNDYRTHTLVSTFPLLARRCASPRLRCRFSLIRTIFRKSTMLDGSCLSWLVALLPERSRGCASAAQSVDQGNFGSDTSRASRIEHDISFTRSVAAHQPIDHRSTPRRLHHFFESTSCNIVLSSVRSATNRFKRRFSSCSCAICRT